MDFIYENENSLCHELCDEIIENFENQETGRYEGLTKGGLQKHIKNTVDLVIPKDDEKWNIINKTLLREVNKNITKYVNDINLQYIDCNNNENTTINNFSILNEKHFTVDDFMIQRYLSNDGKYIYHNDFSVEVETQKFRVLTYLWYLNDVLEGGETDFFNGKVQIKPKKGKLILFPASWTFPHCGKMPKSSNKYIITGWIYETFKK